jgi:hypothetical protein
MSILKRLDIKISQQGCFRNVLLIGNYAIKVPTILNQQNFIYGCYSNIRERNYCKNVNKNGGFLDIVVPSLFCSIFGLIQIQYRCKEMSSEDFALLTQKQLDIFSVWGNDIKAANLGYYNGRLVIFDYQ